MEQTASALGSSIANRIGRNNDLFIFLIFMALYIKTKIIVDVLFISSTGRINPTQLSSAHKKKFKAMTRLGNMYQIARGKGKVDYKGYHLQLVNRFFLLRAFCCGWWMWKHSRINVIYAQSPFLDGLVGCLLKYTTGAQLIIGVHGNWETDLCNRKWGKILPLLNLLAKFTLRCADKVRVISCSTEQTARKHVNKKKIFPIYFPAFFDAEFYLNKRRKRGRTDTAVFVGSLTKTKGFDVLLQAVALVRMHIPEFKLYVCGRGSLQRDFPHVEYLGYCSQEKVKQTIDNTEFLILPSRSEGLGRAALEAMARGKPVIANDVEGLGEIVTNSRGLLLPELSAEQIAEAISFFLRNKQIARDRGLRGGAFVRERFSTKTYINNSSLLFESVLPQWMRQPVEAD